MAARDPISSTSVHKKIKTEQTPIPTPSSHPRPLLERMPTQLIKPTIKMIEAYELLQLSMASKYYYAFFKKELAERKYVSDELLLHVFNANKEKVIAFFTKANSNIAHILMSTCFKEYYYKKEFKKLIWIRYWRNVSPLQAAALCGDNFLVLKLLPYIAHDYSLRCSAAKQLEEVLNRTPEFCKKLAGLAKDENKTTAFKNRSLDSKMKQEKATTSNVSIADQAEYLAPFKNLLNAYNNFIKKHPKLSAKSKWDALNILWEKIGDFQNELSVYGLQEFFERRPFTPLPDFKVEPKRTPHGAVSEIGTGTGNILYKSVFSEVSLGCYIGNSKSRDARPNIANIDAAAILHLYNIRKTELRNIIACLLDPQAIITVDIDDKLNQPISSKSR